MRNLIAGLFGFAPAILFAQDLKDTVFYRSGREQAARIEKISKGTLEVTIDGKSGHHISQIKVSGLKGYYTDKDSSYVWFGTKSDDAELTLSDTLEFNVSRAVFAFNPLAWIALGGISLELQLKGGKNLNHGLIFDFKYFSFWQFADEKYTKLGLGYAYFNQVSTSSSFYVFAQPNFYFFEDPAGALLLGFGGIKYFNEKLGFNYNIGAGPRTSPGLSGTYLAFDVNLGVALNFGGYKRIVSVKNKK